MKTHILDNGWEISLPENWTSDIDDQGTRMFYPENASTTVYASAIHAEKQERSAPIEIMMGAFMNTLPKNVKEIPVSMDKLPCKAFFSKNSDGSFRISAGFFAEGDLLMLNVYSKNESAVWNTLESFKTVVRR